MQVHRPILLGRYFWHHYRSQGVTIPRSLKNAPLFIFHYNFHISWWIFFTLFALMETAVNTNFVLYCGNVSCSWRWNGRPLPVGRLIVPVACIFAESRIMCIFSMSVREFLFQADDLLDSHRFWSKFCLQSSTSFISLHCYYQYARSNFVKWTSLQCDKIMKSSSH